VKQLKYSVVIERDEDGLYVASIPELPGCHTQARSLDEVTSRIKEAAELYLEATGFEATKTEFVGIQILEVSPHEP
jgi:predicted RNase H-like HicB family nuclease